MAKHLSVITIGVDPTIELGPLALAWHGLTIGMGILVGALVAGVEARRRGLDTAPLYAFTMIVVAGALIGGRAFYLAEHDQLLDPGAWIGARGFTFYGGMIAAALGIGLYLWRTRRSVEYLDAVAFGLPRLARGPSTTRIALRSREGRPCADRRRASGAQVDALERTRGSREGPPAVHQPTSRSGGGRRRSIRCCRRSR